MSQPGTYIWHGQPYRGLAAVAQAAKVSIPAVVYHLERHGNLNRLRKPGVTLPTLPEGWA